MIYCINSFTTVAIKYSLWIKFKFRRYKVSHYYRTILYSFDQIYNVIINDPISLQPNKLFSSCIIYNSIWIIFLRLNFVFILLFVAVSTICVISFIVFILLILVGLIIILPIVLIRYIWVCICIWPPILLRWNVWWIIPRLWLPGLIRIIGLCLKSIPWILILIRPRLVIWESVIPSLIRVLLKLILLVVGVRILRILIKWLIIWILLVILIRIDLTLFLLSP